MPEYAKHINDRVLVGRSGLYPPGDSLTCPMPVPMTVGLLNGFDNGPTMAELLRDGHERHINGGSHAMGQSLGDHRLQSAALRTSRGSFAAAPLARTVRSEPTSTSALPAAGRPTIV